MYYRSSYRYALRKNHADRLLQVGGAYRYIKYYCNTNNTGFIGRCGTCTCTMYVLASTHHVPASAAVRTFSA